ncbi:MAG: ATP-binding protein [Dehalococcoidia bacterium]|nr:ATP-binding protein [Dehalococcoidia bacterium]
MYQRTLSTALRDALTDTPVVLVSGARQTGKSTLVQSVVQGDYLTFDDVVTAAAAHADPQGFIGALRRPAILDEVQLVPEIFRAIKYHVDRDRRPGSFILTGSANVLLLPNLSDTLAGRMEVLTLWPLSQGELSGMREGFIDVAFGPAPPVLGPSLLTQQDLILRVLEGGFPEVVGRANLRRSHAWFRSYSTTVLQRHVRDLSDIDALAELPRLLERVAAQAMGIANVASLARSLDLPATSLRRYLNLLSASYVVQAVPGWSRQLTARTAKTEKLTLLDSGLLADLQNVTAGRLRMERSLFGPLLESFVMMELRKQLEWADTLAQLYYLRTHTGTEVDIVIESTDGRVVAIEVKATASPDRRDFRGLEFIRDNYPDRFVRGVLLYTGEQTLPFGDRIWAMPIDGLWRWGAVPMDPSG